MAWSATVSLTWARTSTPMHRLRMEVSAGPVVALAPAEQARVVEMVAPVAQRRAGARALVRAGQPAACPVLRPTEQMTADADADRPVDRRVNPSSFC